MIRNVTTDAFEADVLKSDRPTLVEFATEWCPSCRAMEPMLEALAEEYEGRAEIVRVDAEREPLLATQFGIRAVPTTMIFKDGEVVDVTVGGRPASAMRAKLDHAIAQPVE